MEVQIEAMKEMLARMSGMLETKQQRANITASELGEGMSRSETACDRFDSEMKKISESLKKEQTKNAETHKQSSEKLLQIFNDFTIKSNLAIGSAQNLREETVSSCWSAVNSNEDSWREQYQGAEEELREHAEMLKKYLQSEQEQNQEENVEKLSSSTRSLPEAVDHLPVEFEQDTSNLQKAISDTNVSNVVVNTDSVNQVENGENEDPVEVEQKTAIPTAKGQRRTLRYRKPLLSKNSE
ncbi:hypothetical protein J437_LFUL005919 [Ladona fulva]|uniref:Uncharacterized protein n=1 Tax=Ladona fulva TaxID=123851 RepID=A0A8K0P0K1_LADFU|nr:hypothetical protein J437_LFUL005919 [Ladona fulva]